MLPVSCNIQFSTVIYQPRQFTTGMYLAYTIIHWCLDNYTLVPRQLYTGLDNFPVHIIQPRQFYILDNFTTLLFCLGETSLIQYHKRHIQSGPLSWTQSFLAIFFSYSKENKMWEERTLLSSMGFWSFFSSPYFLWFIFSCSQQLEGQIMNQGRRKLLESGCSIYIFSSNSVNLWWIIKIFFCWKLISILICLLSLA